MGELLKNEKFARLIGNPEKASSYLFYVTSENEVDAITGYFKTRLEAGVSDLYVVRPEDSTGTKDVISIKQIREIVHFVNLSPEKCAKIASVDGAERLNMESANAFLKTLEEPPKDAAILLFAYSENLLPTIKSRCKIYNLRSGEQNIEPFDKEVLELMSGSFKVMSDTVEAYIKNEKLAEIIYTLGTFARQKLLSEKTTEYAKFIREIEKAKKEISRNANPKLTIENLVLNNRGLLRK
jgi:DNA polymerase III delta prime subunit